MDSQIATEALLQRGRTPLYNDLVDLYQETQDALRDLKNASPAKYNLQLKYINYPKKLKAIIKTHMGLFLTKVEIVESKSVNAFATFDVSSKVISQLEKGKRSFVNMIDKISNVYDSRKAFAATESRPDFGFWFGINSGMWSMRNKDNSFFFTAEEMASLTLHEFGHFDHWIRTMSLPVSKILDASDIINYVKTDPDNATILIILSKLRSSKYLDKSWKDALDVTTKYFKDNKDSSDPMYKEAIATLETLIISDVSSRSISDINTLTIFGYFDVVQTPHTTIHELDSERSADDFASRNGAYAALASVLRKIDSFNDVNSHFYVKQFMWSFPGIIVSLLMKFSAVLDVSAEDVSFGYDPMIRRLELIAQTAKHAFSDQDLPVEVRNDINQQIKDVESYIKQREKSPYRVFRKQIKMWKDSISRLGRIVVSPMHSRLPGDYRRLQDANRNLGRHSLYYLAQK